MQSRRSSSLESADVLPRESSLKHKFWGNLTSLARVSLIAALAICGVLFVWSLGFNGPRFFSSANALTSADLIDEHLQSAAKQALGDRRGTVIVLDPQTGRVRAVVNPEIAFAETYPLGSAIKPFTTLAALRSGVIDEDSRTLCHEKYSHHAFQITCSHPRDLPPLNPTEAIAYSCNYYFSTVGERLKEENFTSTLSELGFGKKTGVNANEEISGQLQRSDWRPQNAIGEGNYLQATPIQVINAYVALLNGGRLFTPRLAGPGGFAPAVQAQVGIDAQQRSLIVNGMRGAVRYGSAEKANLYSLPLYIFGKTGTATELNGFRTHGWFVGLSAGTGNSDTVDSDATAENVNLAVLVFLNKGHGFEAAQVARPIFARFAAEAENLKTEVKTEGVSTKPGSSDNPSLVSSLVSGSSDKSAAPAIRVHLVRENTTSVVAFEDYVLGVVAAEGSMETEPEALRALAIAVRTFALKNVGRHARDGYDFCNSTHCERYRPVDSNAGDSVSPLIREAVETTRGEILRDEKNELAESYFSASCGGATANMATLWGGSVPPYLRGVRDEYCANEAHHTWTDVIPQARLLKALQADPRTNVGERLVNVKVVRVDATGRAELIELDGNRRVTVKGWDFKIIVGRALGWNLLKSSHFEIARSGSNFVFHGSGFGHGLGLCQEGAHVMAERGASYRQILAKYFPSTRVANGIGPTAADLLWRGEPEVGVPAVRSFGVNRAYRDTARQTLRSEYFRVSYPANISRRDAEAMLSLLQSSRASLLARVTAAGISVQLPALDVFVNETTGDFVGRTGQPAWAAAATNGSKIELQPLATLKRRMILETTLRHELVHALVEIVSHGRAPRWLAEGLAIHLAGEGRMVSRYQPRIRMSSEAIEKQLTTNNTSESGNNMRSVYAAAYAEVKRLIDSEGEAAVWRRVAK